jgi:hypothetical protein
MSQSAADHRSPERRALDERIAAEPHLPPPEVLPGAAPRPIEEFGVGPPYNGAGRQPPADPTPPTGGPPVNLSLELPADLADALADEAARRGMSLPDYAVELLTWALPPVPPIRTGAELVAYWEAEGLIGTRPDITDPEAHSRALREKSQTRSRE